MAASTFHSSIMIMIMIMITMMIFFTLGYASDAAAVKGCPFTSIYGFGGGGSLMIDHLASAFHLPSPKSYTKNETKIDYGLNFASTGSTVMNNTFFIKHGIQVKSTNNNNNLKAQFDVFATFLDRTCSMNRNEECMKKINRTIFFLDEIGSNDYRYAIMQGTTIKEVSTYVPQVIKTATTAIKNLIDAGATNILVPGILPMGCLPSYLTHFQTDDSMQYDINMCHRGLNNLARLHNDQLWETLFKLGVEYPHVQIVYADYFNAFIALLRDHEILGFKKHSLLKACCGTSDGGPYNFSPSKMCGSKDVPICTDPTTYVHWDGFHLTEEANKNIMDALVSGKNFVYPEFKFPKGLHCVM